MANFRNAVDLRDLVERLEDLNESQSQIAGLSIDVIDTSFITPAGFFNLIAEKVVTGAPARSRSDNLKAVENDYFFIPTDEELENHNGIMMFWDCKATTSNAIRNVLKLDALREIHKGLPNTR